MIERVERELTDLIYAALLRERSWQDFLDRLNGLIPGGVSTLFFHDQGSGEGGISLASGLEAGDARRYAEHYVGLNPWMRHVGRTPLGTGIIGERIVPRDEFVRTEYYADFLRLRDIEAGIGVTLWRESACSFLLSTLTSRIDPDENQRVADLLTRLAPHLTRAFRYYRSGQFGGAAARFGISLFESSRVGVIIAGEGSTIRAASPRGEAHLADGAAVSLSALGTLRLRDETAAALLGQMLSRNYAGPSSWSGHSGAHRLTLIKAPDDGTAGYFCGPSVALLVEEAGAARAGADVTWLVHRFGLTPAETRVVEGIVAGLTLAEVAHAAGISRETVRTQVKAVYAKTGARSQAELVRLALSHPAPAQ